MNDFMAMFSKQTKQVLKQVCKKHDITQIKDIVDVYRHKPDLLFEPKGFSQKCWNEISEVLSNSQNPYMPQDSVISYTKAKLIAKRNALIDELAELSRTIQAMS